MIHVSKTVVSYLEDDYFRYRNRDYISKYLESTDNILKGIIESAKRYNDYS